MCWDVVSGVERGGREGGREVARTSGEKWVFRARGGNPWPKIVGNMSRIVLLCPQTHTHTHLAIWKCDVFCFLPSRGFQRRRNKKQIPLRRFLAALKKSHSRSPRKAKQSHLRKANCVF